jgi:hypothetical protein
VGFNSSISTSGIIGEAAARIILSKGASFLRIVASRLHEI